MYEQEGEEEVEEEVEEAQEEEQQQDEDQGYEQNEEEAQEEQQDEEVEPEQEEEAEADPTSVPTGQRPQFQKPARPPPPKLRQQGKAAPADGKRKGLLIAIAATAVLALVVIIAAAVKFAGGPKSAVFVTATPKDVPFSVTINPGQLRVDKPTKAIELEPGEYTLEFKPSVPGYLSAKKGVSLKPGKTAPVSVMFQRSEPEPVVVNKDPTPENPPPDTKAPDTKTPDTKTPDTKPPDTKAPEVTLWEAVISSSEPGVEIFLDGKSKGTAPVTVKDLAVGKSYEFTAKKSGFETQAFTISNDQKQEKVEKSLSMVKVVVAKQDPPPKADPPPKDDPPPKKDPVVVARQDPPPKKDPPPRADPPPKKDPPKSRVMGKVAFASKPTGAEVWVDGRNTNKKTPVPQPQAIELGVGKHKVVFKLDGKSSAPQEFEVTEANKDKPLVVKGEI